MNIFIDESGSINNKFPPNKCFVISLIHVHNKEKLERIFKRFVSSRMKRLLERDRGRMFLNGKFKELKGSCLDFNLKNDFLDFFSKKQYFDVYYIQVNNSKLDNIFCSNTSRTFNYILKNAICHFIKNKQLPYEDCYLQIDERNEKIASKHFLEDYLNTELKLNAVTENSFVVTYYDSKKNKFVQIADVFANIFYSEIIKGNYTNQINHLKKIGMIKGIYKFPLE